MVRVDSIVRHSVKDIVTGFVCQEFIKVYKELGFGSEEKAPFSVLSQHPCIQHLMESTLQYHLPVSPLITHTRTPAHTHTHTVLE